ncbi:MULTISPECIES: hypothetical protein [Nitrosomonas]|uniref:Uncharacterized protein n=1 Tax=Nitrosomonas eutropha (strain DSM 101675 / C91 / Nm57) TaxID=335283 RepID=Q0AHE1_NITEC|nr:MULTISPECIES: hypothetical protein [Nitrosomonas]ABI59241.1 hypothetical protein Neut_0981 [Nitrosomonas eutropha C91]MXS79294.1 hypothetical protein [Nitrosomonas sp. GH22]
MKRSWICAGTLDGLPRQAELIKNFGNRAGFQDGGNDFHILSTTRTVFDIAIKHPLEQARPTDTRRNRWILCIVIFVSDGLLLPVFSPGIIFGRKH